MISFILSICKFTNSENENIYYKKTTSIIDIGYGYIVPPSQESRNIQKSSSGIYGRGLKVYS